MSDREGEFSDLFTRKDPQRRRILYVTYGVPPLRIGGMQSVSKKHIAWLEEAGHDLAVVHPYERSTPELQLPGRQFYLPWPKRGSSNRLRPFRYVAQLQEYSSMIEEIIRTWRPSVVYSEGPFLDTYLARPLSARVPVVYHAHGLEMYQHKGTLIEDIKAFPMRPIILRHARHAEFVICQGGRLRDILIQKIGTPPSRICTVPNSHVSSEELGVRRHQKSNRFLFVGRDEPRKGLLVLLEAIRQSRSEAVLTIVGNSNQSFASKRVRVLGEIKDRLELMRHYFESDFLVVPSFAEGMPTVACEALAAGRPLIASDVGAINLLIGDKENGFLVPSGNIPALTNAIDAAMSLTLPEYNAMSDRSVSVAHGPISPMRVKQLFLAVIEKALVSAGHE